MWPAKVTEIQILQLDDKKEAKVLRLFFGGKTDAAYRTRIVLHACLVPPYSACIFVSKHITQTT